MHWSHYIFTILLFSITGWLTTWLAVKLIFRPLKPINVFGYRLQGILPKNQQAIAEKLGRLASEEFLSFSAIQEKVTNPDNFKKLRPEIETHIDTFLREKLKDTFPMLSMFIGDKTINQLKAAFLMELENLFPVLMKSYINNLGQELDLEKLITQKIAGFSMTKLEEIVVRTNRKKILYFQLMSAFLGFIMGLLYILMDMLLYN